MTQQPDFWESKQGDGSADQLPTKKKKKKNIKTPDNFGYGDMPPDFRRRYDEHIRGI